MTAEGDGWKLSRQLVGESVEEEEEECGGL